MSHVADAQLTRALHAEWTKLRTVAGPGALLLATIALTAAVGAIAANAVTCPGGGCQVDPARVSLTGIYLGQAIVAIVAVTAVSGEYGTGMMRLTLTATPRRWRVLAAKAAVVGTATLVTGAVAVLASVLAGGMLLARHGIDPAHGYQALSLGGGAVLRAAVGSVLYLTLIALLGLGVAAMVRDSAVAIGTVLGLLYLFPIVAGVSGSPGWHRHLDQISPMIAGLYIQAGGHRAELVQVPVPGRAEDAPRDDREQVEQREHDPDRHRRVPDRGGDAQAEQRDQREVEHRAGGGPQHRTAGQRQRLVAMAGVKPAGPASAGRPAPRPAPRPPPRPGPAVPAPPP